jgi:hypothetical protein
VYNPARRARRDSTAAIDGSVDGLPAIVAMGPLGEFGVAHVGMYPRLAAGAKSM